MAGLLAQIGGPISALGVVALLLTTRRALRLGGLALVIAGGALAFVQLFPEIGLAVALAGALGGVFLVAALALALLRWPWALPIAALACVPARLPLHLGGSDYNLLVPLYAVIGAAGLVMVIEIFRGDERSHELGSIAWPLAAFVAWSAVSIAWSEDVREGSIMLDAFLLPFTLLAIALARLEWPRRLLLILLGELAAMALVITAIGVYQWETREIFWNPKLDISNAYAPFFRVNSVFWDPSVYGRFLTVALLGCLVLVIAPAARRWALSATVAIAVLWLGLLLSFSQSSFAALVAGVIAASLVTWRRRAALPLALTALLVGAVGLATPQLRDRLFDGSDGGLNRITSTRTTLVNRGVRMAADHPLAGVGLGGFKREYAERAGMSTRNLSAAASHTTPVTVAAETGAVGLLLYAWLLAVALTAAFQRADGSSFGGRVQLVCALGLTAIAVHSLFYAGFFEDPMLWGFLAIAVGAASGGGETRTPPRRIPTPLPATPL